ncbi:helix-turn-helix transcriptional regulator [Actinoplanes couchii]|uniref:HTH luxR-type domain-containing protein n=1 Tax=Actinoplanes couchii TaxID=403638 RepID=A0ABQ3XDP8_9ACTN|nr:LuxR family transcriptional regulator [Actinoplanes couchii]MDR6317138.1 DNA-binding CsgD family transcriptional regulator [Actinoplanes couchii]GID56632.1 hypothetical protein Aco03nite_050360 [Actinoplanes couchii]
MDKVDYGPWIDLAGDPPECGGDFPPERVATLLGMTLRALAVSLNWATPVAAGARVWPPIVDAATVDEYLSSGALWCDPLVAWFDLTQQPAPQSARRVPPGFGDSEPRTSAYWLSVMRRQGIRDRLSVSVRLGPRSHVAFVAATGDRDFTDDDLAVVRRLQPLLRTLYRQADVLGQSRTLAPMAGGSPLTRRKLAVLSLLAEGHPAAAIGRRLAISERTVQKHLEHLYRKLKAHDRLTAVLSAQQAGLLVNP